MKEGLRPTLKPCPSTTAASLLVVYRRVSELDEDTIMLGPGKFGTWGFFYIDFIRASFHDVQIKEWLYMQDNPTWWPQKIFFCANKDVSE